VFADPKIEATPAYCRHRAIGSTTDVTRLLGLAPLQKRGLNGKGVRIAVVDTGIDGNHLAPDGSSLSTRIDTTRGFPRNYPPGSARRDHGTMVAYDASIAAPKATLLDYALLRSTAGSWEAFLSDAIAAFGDLIDLLRRKPGSLVVNNSWGLFDRSDDAAVGTPENYSANANHPFNQIVAALVTSGADVIFAAGNCGVDCPDGRCGVNDVGPGASIHGANSHPAVITVAAVTTKGERLGYSSQGPGDLADKKPDIAAYSHFRGSGVFAADGGTSAAAPVLSGVVALLRQQFPSQSAAQMKGLVQSTTAALSNGWNYDTGYGLVTTKAISLSPTAPKQPSKKKAKKPKSGAAWMLVPTPGEEPVLVKGRRKKSTKKKSKSKKATRRKKSYRKGADVRRAWAVSFIRSVAGPEGEELNNGRGHVADHAFHETAASLARSAGIAGAPH
jgi:subtilisin family serine protease